MCPIYASFERLRQIHTGVDSFEKKTQTIFHTDIMPLQDLTNPQEIEGVQQGAPIISIIDLETSTSEIMLSPYIQ